MAKKKAYTAEDLKKAIDEAYELGFKHGLKKTAPLSNPKLASEMMVTNLQKNLSDTAKKLNKELIKKHNESVEKHMSAWASDANKALEEILAAGEHYRSHHLKKADKDGNKQ